VSVELRGGAPPPLALPCGEPAGHASVDFAPLEHSLGSISPPMASGNTGSESVEGDGPAGGDTPTSRWGPAACTSGIGAGAGFGQGMAGAGSPGVELVPLGAAAGAGRGGRGAGGAGRARAGFRETMAGLAAGSRPAIGGTPRAGSRAGRAGARRTPRRPAACSSWAACEAEVCKFAQLWLMIEMAMSALHARTSGHLHLVGLAARVPYNFAHE